MTNNLEILEKYGLKLRLIHHEMLQDLNKIEGDNMFFTEKILKYALEGLSVTVKRLEDGQETIRHVELEAKMK